MGHLDLLLSTDDVRLLTLTGPGGVGKTRLAIAAAEQVAGRFPDGVWFVDLAPLIDPALVVPTVAQVVGMREQPGQDPLGALCAFVGDRRMLLVVDNLEHVLAAAAELDALLAACPRLTILATSREPLHLRREQVVEVHPLAVPEAHPASWSVAGLEEVPTVQLFVARAQAADADFGLSEGNAAAVAELSRRLEGLPLAVELAAARVRVLEPEALLSRMNRSLTLLRWNAPDLPERHRSLRATLEWSYALLSPDQQTLFRQLGVFVGGFTLEAAEAMVSTGQLEIEILAGVAALLDNSLLHRITWAGDAPRYTTLETVREFALEQLQASGEADAARQRHAEYFAALAERAEQEYHSREVDAWLERCRAELGNIRAALAWSASAEGDPEPGLRLAGALWWFWRRQGRSVPNQPRRELSDLTREGQAWLERGLARAAVPAAVRARALAAVGALAAIEAKYQQAQEQLKEAVALSQDGADPFGAARAQWFLGYCLLAGGEAKAAIHHLEAAAVGFRALEMPGWAGMALWDLADAAVMEGDAARAQTLAEEALELSRRAGFKDGEALALERLGWLALGRDDGAEAERYFREALALQLAHDDWYAVAVAAVDLAHLAAGQGHPAPAARLAGAASALCEAIGVELAAAVRAVHPRLVAKHGRLVTDLRATLGEERFATAWAAGHGKTPEEALAVVRAVVSGDEATVPLDPIEAALVGLSPREREVLALVARGLTNRQIGDALFISPRTVNFHVTNLLAKLGLESRAAAAAFAVRHGLA